MRVMRVMLTGQLTPGFSALPLLSPNASHEGARGGALLQRFERMPGWSSGTERRVTPNDLIVESAPGRMRFSACFLRFP